MNKYSSVKNHKWILLIHQLSPKPTSIRVKVWRRLRNIGAVSIKKSVYILPFTKEAYEDFQWVRQEINTEKSDATIFEVNSIEGIQDQEIIRKFQEARNKEYDTWISKILKVINSIKGKHKKNGVSIAQKEQYKAILKKFKAQLNEIVSLDFFQASHRGKAEKTIAGCTKIVKQLSVPQEEPCLTQKIRPITLYDKNEFQNKKWVTRKDIHIDRIASSWLIKNFIDPGATVSFVAEDKIAKNGIGFDMYDTEFSHYGEDCTFETLLKSFAIKDPILTEIAEIVHDIDLKDGKFVRKEAEGINQIIIGLSQKLKSDKKLLERGMEIFNSLYEYYSSCKTGRR